MHTLDRKWGDAGGSFITVRLGEKWVNHVGESVNLCECDTSTEPYGHTVVGTAEISWAHCYTLSAIPDHVLAKHYNEECRNWHGMIAALAKAYGVEVIRGATVAAVLGLRRWD